MDVDEKSNIILESFIIKSRNLPLMVQKMDWKAVMAMMILWTIIYMCIRFIILKMQQ